MERSLVGTRLGDRYRLLELLGEGGMGSVFRAESLTTGAQLALKLLHPDFTADAQIVQRFEREAQVMSRLSHPHIVKVVEFGEAGGRLFLAMELVSGKSLADLVDSGKPSVLGRLRRVLSGRTGQRRLPIPRAVALMSQVLEALEHAHAHGVVHRDLKPDNIMLTRGAPGEVVKLFDFGIAKLRGDGKAASQQLTQLGLAVGTPAYMSPEQASGQEIDARSDLYSCGVILYEVLTGRKPFEADTHVQVMSMHLTATPKPLRSVAMQARIPAALERVVLRALAKKPGDRFKSARELRGALEEAALAKYESPEISGHEATAVALPRSRRRWPRTAVVAAAGVALLASAIAIWNLLPDTHSGPPSASGRASKRAKLRKPQTRGD
jgi:serine/threonine-protein kinase